MLKAAITANARTNVCFLRFIPRAKFLLKVFMINLLFENDFCRRSEVWWSLVSFAPGPVRIAALGFIQQKQTAKQSYLPTAIPISDGNSNLLNDFCYSANSR